MTANEWLVLDNLNNRWPYQTNVPAGDADAALRACVAAGHVREGKLTDSGRAALLAERAVRG